MAVCLVEVTVATLEVCATKISDVRVCKSSEKFMMSQRHYKILGNFGLRRGSLKHTLADVFGTAF